MIKTGLRFFDKTGGLEKKGIILIEGPTGIGKKMLTYHLINNWVKKKKNITLINADGTDERILKIFKKYFKTNILQYPNLIIINSYETKMPLEKIEKIIKKIKLKNEIVIFDSLTGYLFNIKKTHLMQKHSKKIEIKAIENIINYCKEYKKLVIIIANNDLITKESIKKLEKAATEIIKLNFKEEKDMLKREIKFKKEKKNFSITNLGVKV